MKQPLYAILIAQDTQMRENVLSEKKQITIREGHRDYKEGTALVCCHLEPWAVMVDITGVRYCTLSEVTKEEYNADGFRTQEDLLNGMRKFYPKIDYTSPVTVVKWNNVRGKLVDEYRRTKNVPAEMCNSS